jgi:hypothetical protein
MLAARPEHDRTIESGER